MKQKINRDTNVDLMQVALELVKKNGCYSKAEEILEYFSPERWTVVELSDYQFDFLCKVSFGSCEGIYLDCYIDGIFTDGQTETKKLPCGTFKTLSTDLEAMKIFGELGGALSYFATQHINKNISRYSPEHK